MPIFEYSVLNSLWNRGQALPERLFILPERACGEGISKGNFVPLRPPVGVRDPLRRGPGFLLLFSIKSKEEYLCFAEKVPNWRMLIFTKRNFLRDCAQSALAPLLFSAHTCASNFAAPPRCLHRYPWRDCAQQKRSRKAPFL